MVLDTPALLGLVIYAIVISWLSWLLFRMLFPPHASPATLHVRDYGEDRRKIPYVAPCAIPEHIVCKEKYILNSRGMLLHTCEWWPQHVGDKPRALVVQCCGFADSNTFLPMTRSIRLAQQGFAVVGMDPEGHGRSDGLHAYVPSFAALVEDYWQWFTRDIRSNSAYARLPTFLLGESMGGNVVVQLLLRDGLEQTNYFQGAIMLAPMLEVSPRMKPPKALVTFLRHLTPFLPTLPVTPTKDLLSKAFRRAEVLAMAQKAPYGYRLKPRLGTALQLLEATELVTQRASEVQHPYLLLQGDSDVVTCPETVKVFHAKSGSREKELKLYEGMWHSLLSGELEENIETVYRDIFAWLDRRLSPEEDEKRPGRGQQEGNSKGILVQDGSRDGEARRRSGRRTGEAMD